MTCYLRTPNQEVNNLYRTIIASWLSNSHGLMWYKEFTTALVSGDMATFENHLKDIAFQIISYHDFAKEPEAFYHGLLLGLIAGLQESHLIKSNRESGLGRYDILLIPKDPSKLGVLIELKAQSASDTSSLEALAKTALQQIDEKHYIAELKQRNIQRCLKIAIAFIGKQFALEHVIENLLHTF